MVYGLTRLNKQYEAEAEELQGRKHYGDAYGLYLKATRLQPENAQAWFNLGVFDLDIRKCPYAAYPAFNRFTTLDPQNPNNVYYAKTLKLVNARQGIC